MSPFPEGADPRREGPAGEETASEETARDAPQGERPAAEAPRPSAALVPRPLPAAPSPFEAGVLRLTRRARDLAQNPVAVAAASAAATAAATLATSVAVGVVRRALGTPAAPSPAPVLPPSAEVLLRGMVRHEVHVVHHVVRTVHIVQTVQRSSLPGGPLPPVG